MEKQLFESDFGERYTKAVLPSGLQIFVTEKPQYNSAYAIFGTKYGSIDTCFSVDGAVTRVPEGVAHFLEHKLFESEEGDAFTKYAETGAYANAFTSFDRTCYLFSCSNRFEENLQILLDFVQSPYFTAQTVQKEQGIIGQEIRMYDDSPGWRVMFNMLGAMYQNHPVRIDIAGTVESIAQIDDQLLYRCYHTFYHPSNMFLCIAGNVDAEKVLAMAEASVPPKQPVTLERICAPEPDAVSSAYVEQSLSVAQPMFCFGFKEPVDVPERTAKEKTETGLLLEVLAGSASPLYKRLTDQGLINDEFSFEYFTGHGYAAVIFDGESNDPKRVAEEIKREIARLKKEGINPDLFTAIRQGIYGGMIRSFGSVEALAMQEVNCAMFGGGLFDEIELLRRVTPEDLLKRLSLLEDEKSVLSVINPID